MISGWEGSAFFSLEIRPETFIKARDAGLTAQSHRQTCTCNHPDPTLPVFSNVKVPVLDAVIGLRLSIHSF